MWYPRRLLIGCCDDPDDYFASLLEWKLIACFTAIMVVVSILAFRMRGRSSVAVAHTIQWGNDTNRNKYHLVRIAVVGSTYAQCLVSHLNANPIAVSLRPVMSTTDRASKRKIILTPGAKAKHMTSKVPISSTMFVQIIYMYNARLQ